MIWIYEQGHEDFSTNGLGSLLPARCEIKEEQNGAYELELDHPIDEDGLSNLLKTGRVIKAPVPAQTTPIIHMPAMTSYEVWETTAAAKVYTKKNTSLGSSTSVTVPALDLTSIKPSVVAVRGYTDKDQKTVTKWVSNGNRVLEKVEAGVEVSVLSKDGTWYKVTTPNGNTGWMQAASLTLVASIAARPPETIQERKIRDQLFRIYRAEKDTEAGEVKVWARHISYDLLGNVLLDCDVKGKTVTQAIAQIDAACTQADHGFTIYTDSTATVTADWSRKGYLEALLDPDEGLLSLANLRLVRDNYDLFLLERSEVSRQSVSYGTNLMGVTLDINEDSIVNRIVPVGKTKDGEPLYIDAEYVDSPRNDAATIIRAKVIEYSDVAEKEAKDDEPAVTLAQAKAALTAKANEEFDLGVDLPDITVDIDFLQLGDTVEYAAYRDLDRLYLGDLITVRDDAHDVELDAEITQVDYDVLTNRYVHMNVGVTEAARTIGSTASFMLPNGSLGGRKIAMGGIDNGHIKELSAEKITTGTLDAGVINVVNLNADNIVAGSIDAEVIDVVNLDADNISTGYLDAGIIEAGTITATHIGTNEIVANAANIKDGVITNAKIANGTIENAKIKDATIETAKIKDAAITTAKIDDAQVTNAKIANATIETAKIKDAAITTAKIQDAQITNAKIASAGIDFANIKDLDVTGDAIFRRSVVGDGSFYLDRLIVNSANIGTATIGELMVRDAQGKLHKVLIGTNGEVSSEEVKVDGQNLSTDAMMQVSQRLVWRQATQPSAPFIGMIWMDTSLTPAGKPKEILRRCTAIAPSVVWEVVQSNELHTNVIDVDDNGMNILSGGNLNLLSGGAINIKNLSGTANVINMDNTGLTLSSTGQLKLQSTDSIIIGGSPFSVGGTNLLTDSDFSRGLWVNPEGSFSTSTTYEGKPAGYLRVIAPVVNGYIYRYINNLETSVDTSYTVSFQYLTQSNYIARWGGNAVLIVRAIKADDSFVNLTMLATELVDADGTWRRATKTFTIPAGTVRLRIAFYVVSNGIDNNLIYLSNIQVEKGTTATDWSTSPQDTISALAGIGTQITGLQTQVDGKIDTYFGTDDPSTGWTSEQKLAATGDMWYNSTAKKLRRWNGTSWDNITDQTAIDAYELADTAKDTADGKRRVFVAQPVPPYDEGDLWAGGASGDLKRCSTAKAVGGSYAAGDWVLASKYTDDSGLTDFISNTYNPAIASKTTVFYGATKPTYTAVGDIWYESANGGIYRCTNISTQAHTEITSVALKQALSAASSAQTTANGKITTFVGSSTPTALAAGDLWMDTGNKNIWKRATAAGTGGWVQYLTAAGYLITTGVTIDGTDLTVKATGNLNLAADGNLNVQNGGNLNVDNGGDIEISNGGDINVASGGKINVSATDLIISGKTVETYASDKIRLEVSVGGTNLLTDSDFSRGLWVNPEGSFSTSTTYEGKPAGYLRVIAPVVNGYIYRYINNLETSVDTLYTVSFQYLTQESNIAKWGGSAVLIVRAIKADDSYVNLTMPATELVDADGTWKRATKTFTIPAGTVSLRIAFYVVSNGTSNNLIYLSNIQVEKGTTATDWSPAPSDPASGVKTSKIEIGPDFIDIDSGGTLTLNAADDIKIGAGSDTLANTIDLSANNSIKLAVTSQSANLFPSDPSNWIQGSILSADGSNTASTTRIRSADYITLNAGTLYTVSRVKSLTCQIFLHYYNNSNAYIGNSGAWATTYPYSFSLPSGATKMRVIVRTAADGAIVPTDVPGILFSIVPAGVSGGVKTSYIDIATDHIDIATGGNITMSAGALMKLLAAVVQIDASDAANSYINFGNAFNVSKGADGNFALTINSPTDNAIMVNNKPVWHKGNILVQQNQPASGSGVLWMKPVTTSQVIYAMTVASKSSSTYAGGGYKEYSLANQSADTMSTAGTYSFALKFTLRHYGDGNYTVSQITITLTKGGKTLTLYTGSVTVGGWSSKEVTATATTTDTEFTSGTGVINCKIQPSGTIPYSVSDFLAHEVGSPITATITGPGGGGSAQLCEVKYVP